jgi:LmbE family N-acetylglucosaminyl deacetylase
MTDWVFLSPHFDDVVLSVGGLVWELAQRGDDTQVWTICAGDPPSAQPLSDYAHMLHMFWELGEQGVPYARSLEDAASCHVLHAAYRRYTVPDCIYRYHPITGQPIVSLPDDINTPLEPDEAYLVPPVTDFLRKNLPPAAQLVAPLAIGHHRDHLLTRLAAEGLGAPLWYFVDYPYVVRDVYDLADFIPVGAEQFTLPLSADAMSAWQEGILCHKSQMIMLFADAAEMRQSIQDYAGSGGGSRLWKF